MPVLSPSEYDQAYFEGEIGPYSHNAGYTSYARMKWRRRDLSNYADTDRGEHFADIAAKLIGPGPVQVGDSVLVVGCAYGFMVEALRDQGMDAYGLDVSSYAIGQASETVAPYLTVGDARSYLANYNRNAWDWLITRWFLCCIDDSDMPDLVDEMNRITKQDQVHIIMPVVNTLYYNEHSLIEWRDNFDWQAGTIFVPGDKWDSYITKVG